MSKLKEMKYLLEEDRVLSKIIDELKRQYHRLEVEELNLKAAIREKGFEAFQNSQKAPMKNNKEAVQDKPKEENLELDVHRTLQMLAKGGFLSSEEEESEEDN